MRIIFDTNIWVSFLIGKRLAFFRSFFECPDVEIWYSVELELEFLDVANREKIRKYVDEKQIERVHQLMINSCYRCEINVHKELLVRDPKDAYLLALSDSVCADYLITGDADFKDIRQHNQTRIIDVGAAFLLLR